MHRFADPIDRALLDDWQRELGAVKTAMEKGGE
jgi:hypothetical protein